PVLTPHLSTHPRTTPTYTLSLHDALPISSQETAEHQEDPREERRLRAEGGQDPDVPFLFLHRHHERRDDEGKETGHRGPDRPRRDRKSTRLNSSHRTISYAVFCLKKKKKI